MAEVKELKRPMGRMGGPAPVGTDFEAEVLFQRIYDKWYAFSVVEEDCLVTEVPEQEVHKRYRRLLRAA